MSAKRMILERYFGTTRRTQRRRAKVLKLISYEYRNEIPCPRGLAKRLNITDTQVYNDLSWLKRKELLDVPNEDFDRDQRRNGVATAYGKGALTMKGREVATVLRTWKV